MSCCRILARLVLHTSQSAWERNFQGKIYTIAKISGWNKNAELALRKLPFRDENPSFPLNPLLLLCLPLILSPPPLQFPVGVWNLQSRPQERTGGVCCDPPNVALLCRFPPRFYAACSPACLLPADSLALSLSDLIRLLPNGPHTIKQETSPPTV